MTPSGFLVNHNFPVERLFKSHNYDHYIRGIKWGIILKRVHKVLIELIFAIRVFIVVSILCSLSVSEFLYFASVYCKSCILKVITGSVTILSCCIDVTHCGHQRARKILNLKSLFIKREKRGNLLYFSLPLPPYSFHSRTRDYYYNYYNAQTVYYNVELFCPLAVTVRNCNGSSVKADTIEQ